MKYTVDNTIKVGKPVDVFLDGEQQTGCIEADDEQGYIIRNKRDENGNLIIEGDEFVRETIHGTVEVRPQRTHLPA